MPEFNVLARTSKDAPWEQMPGWKPGKFFDPSYDPSYRRYCKVPIGLQVRIPLHQVNLATLDRTSTIKLYYEPGPQWTPWSGDTIHKDLYEVVHNQKRGTLVISRLTYVRASNLTGIHKQQLFPSRIPDRNGHKQSGKPPELPQHLRALYAVHTKNVIRILQPRQDNKLEVANHGSKEREAQGRA